MAEVDTHTDADQDAETAFPPYDEVEPPAGGGRRWLQIGALVLAGILCLVTAGRHRQRHGRGEVARRLLCRSGFRP